MSCRNIEIKARVADMSALTERVRAIADSGPMTIVQDDTFYRFPGVRLKLRRVEGDGADLVLYERPDIYEAKESRYCLVPISAPQELDGRLSRRYGRSGRVRKERILFLVGNTRIHLDRVEGLGGFCELEVVLKEGDTVEEGIETARRIMEQLAIPSSTLVAEAYVDLLNAFKLVGDGTDERIHYRQGQLGEREKLRGEVGRIRQGGLRRLRRLDEGRESRFRRRCDAES